MSRERVQTERPVLGSWVTFDPTGRDMLECLEAGHVTEVYFSPHDDGDTIGRPRVLMGVAEQASSTVGDMAVTVVHSVHDTEEQARRMAHVGRTAARLVRLGRDLHDIREDLEACPVHLPNERGDAVANLDDAGDYIDSAIGAIVPGEFNVPDDRPRIERAPCGCTGHDDGTGEPCAAHHPDTRTLQPYKVEVFASGGTTAISRASNGQDVAHVVFVDATTAADDAAEPDWRELTDAERQKIVDTIFAAFAGEPLAAGLLENLRGIADYLSEVRTNLTDPGYAYDVNAVMDGEHLRDSVDIIDKALAACRAVGACD